MGKRRAGREVALRALYATELNPELEPPQAVAWVLGSWTTASEEMAGLGSALQAPTEDEPLEAETHAFALRLVRGVAERLSEIDKLVGESSKNWRIERMSFVDRTVLRLATCELLIDEETPSAIVLSEAVELAQRYGSEQSSGFVNGVLDAIKAQLRPRA